MAFNSWNFGFNFNAVNGVTPVTNQIVSGLQQVQSQASQTSNNVAQGFFQMQVAQDGFAKASAGYEGMRSLKKDFADYSVAIAEVSTLWEDSNVNMDKYTGMVEGLSKTYGSMPVDTTKALYTAVSSGFNEVATAGPILETSMKLAIGGVTDVQQAMDGLTTAMHAWQLPAQEATSVSDAMFVAMRAGKTTIGEISRELGQSAALANTLNMSYSDLLAGMSALTLGGKNTSESMTGLKGIMAEVIRQDPASVKAVAEWNKTHKGGMVLDFSTRKFKEVGLKKFLDDIKLATGGDEKILSKLFGRVDALTTAMSLSGAQGKQYGEFLQQMGKRAGSTDVAVAKMAATATYSSKRYEAAFQIMKIKTGEALDPVLGLLRKFKWALVDAMTWIAQSAPWLVQFVGVLVLIGAVIGMLIAKIILFATIKGLVVAAIKAIGGALTAAFAPVGLSLLPIIAIILGIIAVGYLLYKAYKENWGGFADGVDYVRAGVALLSDALSQLWNTGEIVGDSVDKLANQPRLLALVQTLVYTGHLLMALWSGIKKGFQDVGDILDPLKSSFNTIGNTIKNLKNIWSDAFGTMKSDASGAEEAMSRWKIIGWWIGAWIGNALRAIAAGISIALSLVFSAVAVVVNAVMSVIKIVQGVIEIFSGNFSKGFGMIATGLKNLVVGTIAILLGLIKNIFGAILGIFGITGAEFDAFLKWFGGLFIALWTNLVGFFSWIVGGLSSAFWWVVNGMIAIWNNFSQFFRWIGSGIVGAWDWVVGKIVAIWQWFGDMFGAVGGWIKKQWESIVAWFRSNLGFIVTMAEKMYGIGKTLKKGIVGGIEYAAKGAAGVVNTITGNSEEEFTPGTHRAAGEAYVPDAKDISISAQTSRPVLEGGPSAVTVNMPPPVFNGRVVLDGREVGQFIQNSQSANNEEKMTTVLPVYAGR